MQQRTELERHYTLIDLNIKPALAILLILHYGKSIQIILVQRGPLSPVQVYLQLQLAYHVYTELRIFEILGAPSNLVIFMGTGTGIGIQTYRSQFLNRCALSVTRHPL